VTDTNDYVTSP